MESCAGVLKQMLPLISDLQNYSQKNPLEIETADLFLELINSYEDCFTRDCLHAHITASAMIVNQDFSKTLLTHHKALDKWIQLGGHADGEKDALSVALKEAEEESGLKNLKFLSDEIFDLDTHFIPKHEEVFEHHHYDIRYLLQAHDSEEIIVSSESKDVQWIEIERVEKLTTSDSIKRMIEKIQMLQTNS